MKKFERLIIYPLLIVALFYSMAGDQVMTGAKQVYDEIIAKDISIVNDEGKVLIKLGETKKAKTKSGYISIYDNKENINLILSSRENSGSILGSNEKGPLFAISSGKKGIEGNIQIFNTENKNGINMKSNAILVSDSYGKTRAIMGVIEGQGIIKTLE